MFEFMFGILMGFLGSVMIRDRPKFRSIGTQVDELVVTRPILIQNSKNIFVPKLHNFWGPDS
jgi:hypothetical protein